MPRISTSSWSLHRALGRPPLYGPGESPRGASAQAEVSLLDVPARLKQIGIGTLEIVHFHLPTINDGYLTELRAAIEDAGIELFSVLIDAGDITHPNAGQRAADLRWICEWIDVAAKLGASHARVVAGYTPVARDGRNLKFHPVIQLSATYLRQLADYAAAQGVRVITENFRETGNRANQLLAILELCEGKVGLCADFGNFQGPNKHLELAALFPHADSAHVKAEYIDGQVDCAELARTLSLLSAAGFDGPMSLIFDTPLAEGETEWDNLVLLRQEVVAHIC
ncbi:TIM barrel protein [bacterium]|nr:TIM barrel protein [bacterium]